MLGYGKSEYLVYLHKSDWYRSNGPTAREDIYLLARLDSLLYVVTLHVSSLKPQSTIA